MRLEPSIAWPGLHTANGLPPRVVRAENWDPIGSLATLRQMPTRQHAASPGASPGTLTIDPQAHPSKVRVIAYGPKTYKEEEIVDIEQLADIYTSSPKLWVDIVGLGTADTIRTIGRLFDLHPLVLEDMIHVQQRPKIEEYDDYNFIVVRTLQEVENPTTEQLAIVLKKDCVITVQERPGDCLDPVRTRLRSDRGRHRSYGSDYMAYSIIDAVIDYYAPHLDWYSERIEKLEHHVLDNPEQVSPGEIYDLKHSLLGLRRILLPMRDAIGRLYRDDVPLFSKQVDPYLRDCYDHAVRLIENLEVCREGAVSLLDLHLSTMSHRMNEVMKVLTIIATIFIPLSFITGLYGMNFDPKISRWNMPELSLPWGYPAALGVMLFIAVLLLFYFRRKGWLGGTKTG